MKHGDKAKGKASKASNKKAKSSASGKGRAPQSSKAKETRASKTVPKSSAKTTGSNGKGRPTSEGPHFTNPVVGAAFKRAIKKYPNAFRRLTD
jgi:hypothetical protein